MTIEISGFVLENQPYKENDALVTVLTESGCKTIYARGVLKTTSKNRVVCQPFTLVEMTIDERDNGLATLRFGRVLTYYHHIVSDLTLQSVCFVLIPYIKRVDMRPFLYQLILSLMENMHTNTEKIYTYACLFLREVLVQEGLTPYTSGCVSCGRTDHLVRLSLKQGGFVCQSCNDSSYTMTKKELIQVHSLFSVKENQIDEFVSMYTFDLDDFIFWAHWLEYYQGSQNKALSFLQSIR